MSESKRFSRESLTYVLGEFLSKSLTFLLLPLYARYLSIDDFAIWGLVSAIWPLLVIILGKGFSSYIIRGYYEYEDKKVFLGTMVLFSTILGTVIALGIHATGPWLFGHLLKKVDYRPFIQYAVFFAVFRLFFNHIISIYQAKRMPRTSVLLSVVLFASHLIAVLIAIVAFQADLKGLLNAQLAAYILVALLYLIKIAPHIQLRFKWRYLSPALVFVLPLIPHAASGWSINYISRIFIERSMRLTDLAVYHVAVQIALILSIINNGLNRAWVPFVCHNYTRQDFIGLFETNARKIVILMTTLGSLLMLFSRELFSILGKVEFMDALTVLPILIVAYIAQIFYFIYLAIIIYHKETGWLPVISISSGGICILLNFILIQWWDMYGAAISTGISILIMIWGARIFSKKHIDLHIVNRALILFFSAMIIFNMIAIFFINPMPLLYSIPIKILLAIGMLYSIIYLKLFQFKNLTALFSQNTDQTEANHG